MTRWLWQAADGSVTDLSAWSAGTYVVADGTAGELAPTYTFASQSFAGVDGDVVQQLTADPRRLTLGLDLVDDGTNSLRTRVRALAHALRPRAGIGSLQAVDPAGRTRTLPCYYSKGLESGTWRDARYRTALEFYAPSPWWRGDPLLYTYSLAAPSTFFPILPMVLSASTIQGQTTVNLSDTDAPTYPLWTVTGPGSQLTLANDTTGQQLVLTPTGGFGDGQVVAIDTRPGQQRIARVTLNADGTVATWGTSLFGSLSSDPALWPLVDGVNVVRAILTNAGAASRISLRADRLYSGGR